ncbi:transglutaminaseTgpA domain-containing protein [Peribacillus sp. NPDC097284]|uniref:transglutaminaseTgpA domain-containing protein n=1 Tax=Peribacillus sp. NPDC097284 TaxID=3364401 RepID=UPI0037F6B78C
MNADSTKSERWMHVLLYIFGLLLITEWLRPVEKLTDTGNILIFIIFVLFSLLLHYFGIHWFVRFILVSAFILIAVHFLYSSDPFLTFKWLTGDLLDITANASNMYEGKWELLSNPFRTLLFFVLLWLVTYLIHYWVTVRRNIFLLYILTIIFLSILDTFTPYDGDMAMIRIIIIGFSMLGVLAMIRLSIQERLVFSGRPFSKWAIMLAGMLLVSVLVGFTAPKFASQWPDPVPFIVSYSDKVTGSDESSVEKRVGYDEDDSSLGGSIEPDNTVIFYNTANTGHYWKVENKDIYTGKGWVSVEGMEDYISFSNGQDLKDIKEFEIPEVLKTEDMNTRVTMMESYSHLLHPQSGYLKKVEAENGDWFKYYTNMDKYISVDEGSKPLTTKEYELVYEMPSYDLADLRKVTEQDETMDVLMESNTQLPEGLPTRIYELANELTANEDNWYDKAKAIENHFDGPEFSYSKEDIPYPGDNQDYVDQFLFETQIGYCDNYSTAMVILLRAANIPARWVKGYTEGEKSIYKGESAYKVTNNNAHSWVEVYFSGLGWVPFEPTKGFNGQMDFYNSDLNSENTEETEQEDKKLVEQDETQTRERPDTPENEPGSTKKSVLLSQNTLLMWSAGIILCIALLLVVGYLYRRKWLPFVQILRLKKKTGPYFVQAYQLLLKQLVRAGLERPEGQTLREYAAYVDAVYETNLMQEMTARYEVMTYRGDPEEEEWERFRSDWETLMKKTSS